MSDGYRKLTRDDIDFPRYCLFFIKKIQENIDENGIKDKEFLSFYVDTLYPYCSDAFDLIVKTFERKGFDVNTPTFKLKYESNVKHYIYKWSVRKHCVDDLPF